MRWPSSGLTRWFVGIALDFDRSGVGDPGCPAGDADPDVPALEGAYSWQGDDSTETIIAHIGADAERLSGEGSI
jgi:hypothetical protein